MSQKMISWNGGFSPAASAIICFEPGTAPLLVGIFPHHLQPVLFGVGPHRSELSLDGSFVLAGMSGIEGRPAWFPGSLGSMAFQHLSLLLLSCGQPGPETVTVVKWESFLPSSVQIAPVGGAVRGLRQGDGDGPVAAGIDGDRPGLVAALHLPLRLGDGAVVVLGERVVPQGSRS